MIKINLNMFVALVGEEIPLTFHVAKLIVSCGEILLSNCWLVFCRPQKDEGKFEEKVFEVQLYCYCYYYL